ncbi:hypothetical protein AAG570_011463 [Ranatra chinensis]|uniref:Nose resistant-to-fluoxetine protein N-terminal domain-containing protein n=1 Tax=Ranatra chinensis TaxID=642074 RepID=A0ABD0YKV0_9HEMI
MSICRNRFGPTNSEQETTYAVADSSGKYSSEFFYGNELWMGSKTECLRLNTLPEAQPPFRATYQTAMVNVTLPQHLMPKNMFPRLDATLAADELPPTRAQRSVAYIGASCTVIARSHCRLKMARNMFYQNEKQKTPEIAPKVYKVPRVDTMSQF